MTRITKLQDLWSGYGKIFRCEVQGGKASSVIVKLIQLDHHKKHPKGWNSDLGHLRKAKSYQVERHWYENYADLVDDTCRIPRKLGFMRSESSVALVLEDLTCSGYPLVKTAVNGEEVSACLSWLANFHATFMGEKPEGLWEIGTYWHLDTRPEELAALKDAKLKKAALRIDQILNECSFQTFVHGDAKLANFCFSVDGQKVAAVDFQYVGGGCGMKDVAYFIGSCLSEAECAKQEKVLLDHYFDSLGSALSKYQPNIDPQAVEDEWRKLFPFAWTDFHRFLKGWSPGHWKINDYSEKLSQRATRQLKLEELDLDQLERLALVAQEAARQAGGFVQQASHKESEVLQKEGGSSLSSKVLTAVDLQSQKIILNRLENSIKEFNFGLLTEEAEDDGSRFTKTHFWCIDPLDGTLPFTERHSGYAVSIALVSRSGEALIGVVYDPVSDHLYCAIKGQGVKRNEAEWMPTNTSNRLLLCSNRSLKRSPRYSKLLKEIKALAEQNGQKTVEERQWGGTVMNAIWILEEGPGCYVVLPKKEKGGGSIWDFAAIVAIYNELSLPATNFDGYSILLNTPGTTFMNEQGALFCSSLTLHASLSKLAKDV